MGPKPLRSPSSPSEVVTVGRHLSPLHHREPDGDSFLLPVLILESDWDTFVVPVVISELDWDSFVVPVVNSEPEWDSFLVPEWESFLEPEWDLFEQPVNLWARSRELVYRRNVIWAFPMTQIICTACSNRSMYARPVRVLLLHHLQGSRGQGLPILARLDRP